MRLPAVLGFVLVIASAAACKDEGTITVHSLKFNGVEAVDESRLRNALATKSSSRLPFSKKKYFDRSRFDEDLKRIQAFYADRGYPEARVTGFDVKLNDKQDAVDVTLNISEGDPVNVSAITFTGFDVIPPDHLDTMKKEVPLKVGQPRDRQLVVTTHEMALNELKDHGYPYAKVSTQEDNASSKEAALTFTADPGTLAYFGPIQIQGNKSVSDRVIQRQLTFKPGDLYRRSVVQDSQRRLYGLELFQFANIEPQTGDQKPQQPPASDESGDPNQPVPQAQPAPSDQPDEIPMRVTVAEGNHQRVNFGVGYGSEEKARIDSEYHHLNFLGGARTAGVHARWSSLDRGLRLDFNQPYFYAPHFSLGAEGQHWLTFTPAYRSVTTGARATLTHRQSQQTSWSVSINGEHDSSSVEPVVLENPKLFTSLIALGLNPLTGEQNGTLNSVGFDFQHSTADNLLNAHRGYQVAFHLEQAGEILPGTFKFTAWSADGRHYLPISGSLTLASRLQLGNLRPAFGDDTLVPFGKRYFLGGATTIRGWGRYEVSPLSPDGFPIGGDSMLAFTEELRAIIHGNFGAVLFLDGGNAWAETLGFDLRDLRYAVGPGLRYQTPIGPIRFDFGWQLNPIPGLKVDGEPQTRRWRIHFSIGQAF
ncbi:MAG TPA: BamA/TamA family outer membrane protein [Vicinamibacterales bacterium]|nr:BamA/TamA family outer membrane protein [Vicinamibacterales bacterium]